MYARVAAAALWFRITVGGVVFCIVGPNIERIDVLFFKRKVVVDFGVLGIGHVSHCAGVEHSLLKVDDQFCVSNGKLRMSQSCKMVAMHFFCAQLRLAFFA